ncbi:MAG: T9SS type A sorting domain-containing protein, partial [Bacteroidales bacterium]|nr:T9SS type A sorting domain-containing protein [Bacteroidales bacterium]
SSDITFFDEVEIAFEDTVLLCAGSSLTLTAPLGDTYEWGEGEDTQEIEVTEEGWYYLTVTIATCSGNDSTYVQLVELPETFDLGEDIYTCAASYLITGPEVIDLDYLWSTLETTQSIEVTETGTYTLTLLNENGCGVSDDIMIEFGTSFEFSLYENDTIESCQGNTEVLATEIGVEWLWSTSEETISIEVANTDWYYLTVTDEGGCFGNDSVYVLFNELPAINIGEDLQFCDGLNAELSAPESVSYLWNTGAATQTITIDTAGVYSCTITDINGCSNSDEMTLSIQPSPDVDLGEDMIVDEDQVLIFGTQLGHTEYLWSTGATTDYIVVNASDLEMGINSISVTVTGSNGCIASDEVIITVIPGASVETENINKYSIYPNPSSEIINIDGENIVNINIYDCLGREILSTDKKQIDISSFSNGVYTIVVKGQNQQYTSKLIKQ